MARLKRRVWQNPRTLVFICLALATPTHAQNQPPQHPPAGVRFERDVTFGKGGDTELKLNLARPEKSEGVLPCIVVIHGGGWRAGNRTFHDADTWRYAQQGYVSATVSYRFAPQDPFPAQVEDVKCAVRYLRAHAEQYGLDPKRIGAVGYSAGAHLSMMLGTMDKDDGLEGNGGWPDQSSKAQVVVAYFGPTDLAAGDMPEGSKKPYLFDLIGGTLEEKPAEYKLASPISYVNAGDAPTLIFQGTKDPLVPHTQAFRMIEALTQAGVPGRADILIGHGHGWGGPELARTQLETLRFFDAQLKPKADASPNAK